MAGTVNSKIRKVLNTFRKHKVLTALELASLLQCSVSTVRRRLKEWNCYTSYNQNGRYYVLPDVAQFGSNWLWRYRGTCFSKYGNLTETLIHLVKNSKAGLSGSELGALLGIQPRSFLWFFHDHPDLRREKHQGCFVYFSSGRAIYAQQKSQRLQISRSAKLPSAIEATAILTETIKHPEMSIEELCAQLARKRHQVTVESVQNLFAYHGLAIKKTQHLP